MKNKYIIINKSVLEKRIEDLFIEAKELLEEDGLDWQDEFLNYKDFSPNFEEYSDNSKYFYIIMGKIESLQDFLSQSTPLIPEIEKQKLEFAIEQLRKIKIAVSDKNPFTVYNIAHQIQELEQKLSKL